MTEGFWVFLAGTVFGWIWRNVRLKIQEGRKQELKNEIEELLWDLALTTPIAGLIAYPHA